MEGMDSARATRGFTVIAWLGMAWNTLGAGLYLWTKLDPVGASAGASQAMQDYIANIPTYAHIGWSLGIWGSFVGSVLMLLGKRGAVGAFLVSLLGALTSFGAQARAGVLETPMAAFIIAIIALLLWYARRSEMRGLIK